VSVYIKLLEEGFRIYHWEEWFRISGEGEMKRKEIFFLF